MMFCGVRVCGVCVYACACDCLLGSVEMRLAVAAALCHIDSLCELQSGTLLDRSNSYICDTPAALAHLHTRMWRHGMTCPMRSLSACLLVCWSTCMMYIRRVLRYLACRYGGAPANRSQFLGRLYNITRATSLNINNCDWLATDCSNSSSSNPCKEQSVPNNGWFDKICNSSGSRDVAIGSFIRRGSGSFVRDPQPQADG